MQIMGEYRRVDVYNLGYGYRIEIIIEGYCTKYQRKSLWHEIFVTSRDSALNRTYLMVDREMYMLSYRDIWMIIMGCDGTHSMHGQPSIVDIVLHNV